MGEQQFSSRLSPCFWLVRLLFHAPQGMQSGGDHRPTTLHHGSLCVHGYLGGGDVLLRTTRRGSGSSTIIRSVAG